MHLIWIFAGTILKFKLLQMYGHKEGIFIISYSICLSQLIFFSVAIFTLVLWTYCNIWYILWGMIHMLPLDRWLTVQINLMLQCQLQITLNGNTDLAAPAAAKHRTLTVISKLYICKAVTPSVGVWTCAHVNCIK